MTKFVAISVPHNGYHLLKNRVMTGYDYKNCHDRPNTLADNTVVSGHYYFYETHLWVKYLMALPSIIVLRHPARSLLSFQKRNKTYTEWFHQWSTMILMDGLFINPLYVHIDNKDIRNEQALRIRKSAGIKDKEIDWSVTKGNGDNSTGSYHDTEFAPIGQNDPYIIPQLFIDYYFEKMKAHEEGYKSKFKIISSMEGYSKCA